MSEPMMDFDQWLRYGMEQRWCGPSVCQTHDGVPMSKEEDDAFIDGGDPCVYIVRLYEDAELGDAVEHYHGPSVWRDQ